MNFENPSALNFSHVSSKLVNYFENSIGEHRYIHRQTDRQPTYIVGLLVLFPAAQQAFVVNWQQQTTDSAVRTAMHIANKMHIANTMHIATLDSLPVAVTVRSMVWDCDRSIAGIAGSNFAEGMDVCLL